MLDVSALKTNLTNISGLFKLKPLNFNLKTAIVTLLILGLAIFAYIGWTRQSQVAQNPRNVIITFISPRSGLAVLGNTAIRAKITLSESGNFIAKLNVDGVFEKNLTVEPLGENLVNVSGIWESGKLTPGEHNLEIAVYNEKTNPPALVGKSSIAVKTVSP